MNKQRSRSGAQSSGKSADDATLSSSPVISSSTVSPARRAAFEVLRRVEEEAAYASVVLPGVAGELSASDRALCHELVLGVLRWQLWLDKVIEHFAGRDAGKLDGAVRRALRLGLYQLRFLARVPAAAAVNEAVAMVRRARLGSAAGFVNAVLRRATREADYDPALRATDEIERVAIQTSHPRWLIEKWSAAQGSADAALLAAANNRTPPVAFRLTRHEQSVNAIDELRLMSEGCIEIVPSQIASGAWRVGATGGSSFVHELARTGALYLQSESSQLVAHLLGAKAGASVLDVCAAPGSKTTHIATLTDDKAFIVAGDIHAHRLRTLGRLAAVQDVHSIRRVTLDGEQVLPFADASFDSVLVDAPCTGTGTLQHNPEIRWRITHADINRLAHKQKAILRNAALMVRAGGRLVYSTCSVEPEENEDVVRDFLAGEPTWRIVPEAVHEHLRTEFGAARTWTHRHDTDGFFIAVLEQRMKDE